MNKYERGAVLGQGTFGSVYKAVHKETGKVVAIKEINVKEDKEGINVTSLREIKLLKELKCPHVVELLDVFPYKKRVSMVFEFLDSDLEALIKAKGVVLSAAHIKAYMQMLLKALDACHKHWILHRDIKPNNMLISVNGEFKLADFGLARIFGSPERRLTNQVFARWYRAPELLMGAHAYGGSVDIWAAGCVFAELLLRRPWLPGNTDIEQLTKIFAALGTPTKDAWPDAAALPNFVEFTAVPAPPLRQQFPQASDDALDLLSKMVQLDPRKRPSAEDALAHPYFSNAPPPAAPHQLPKPPLREDNPLALPPGLSRPPPKAARPAGAAPEGAPSSKKPRQSVASAGSSGMGEGGGGPAAASTAAMAADAELLGRFSPHMTPPIRS